MLILKNQSSEVRRVSLSRGHSPQPKSSWCGESVGHYENGDTWVVDTIGFNDRTHVDLFRTPHNSKCSSTKPSRSRCGMIKQHLNSR